MSTKATIEFSDHGDKKFYVYRHCDGYPEQVIPDIMSAINQSRGFGFMGKARGLVSFFIRIHFRHEQLPDYELTSGFHGDESYRYFVKYNQQYRVWEVSHES